MKLALYLFVFFASLIADVIVAFIAFGAVMLGTFVLIPAIDFYIPAVILALLVFVIVMLFGSQKLLKRFDNHLDNLQNRQFDIAFSLTILAPFFLIGCTCSTWFFWILLLSVDSIVVISI